MLATERLTEPRRMRTFLLFLLLSCGAGGGTPFETVRAAYGSTAPLTEIRVTLFGQPCLLQGPLDEASLKTIHAISPEQLFPNAQQNLTTEQIKRAQSRLQASKLPSFLDRYRERLSRRLEALLGFYGGLEAARKARKAAPLIAGAHKRVPAKRAKEFESLAHKLDGIKDFDSDRAREIADQLFDIYGEGIEADPEEEFHRAIQRANVQYTCSFEENGDE
jgi:hypothetical protein